MVSQNIPQKMATKKLAQGIFDMKVEESIPLPRPVSYAERTKQQQDSSCFQESLCGRRVPLDLCLSVHTTEPEAQLLSCCTQLTAQKYITQVKQKQIPVSN